MGVGVETFSMRSSSWLPPGSGQSSKGQAMAEPPLRPVRRPPRPASLAVGSASVGETQGSDVGDGVAQAEREEAARSVPTRPPTPVKSASDDGTVKEQKKFKVCCVIIQSSCSAA